jgi:hypothetical protein
MIDRIKMFRSVGLKIGLMATVLSVAGIASPSFAASCIEGSAKMSDSSIQSFIGSPGDLLMSNIKGGLQLSNAVRQLVVSDSATLDSVLRLVASSNSDQSAAIGSGLARAVQACKTIDPAYADKIQQAVASLNNPGFLTAFTQASNQITTAALGPGAGQSTGQAEGGGATTSTSSQTGGTNNGRSGAGSSSFANAAFSFSSGTSGQFVSSPTN